MPLVNRQNINYYLIIIKRRTSVLKKKASDHLNIDTTGEKVGADQVAAKSSPGQ